MDSKYTKELLTIEKARSFQLSVKQLSPNITGATIHAYLEPVEIIVHSSEALTESEIQAIENLINS